jgi:hypothetical protein
MQFLNLLTALTCLCINNSSALQIGQEAKIQEVLKEKSLIAAKGYSSNSYGGFINTLST